MSTLSAGEAYRLWAPTYSENAITFLDEEAATALSPTPAGKRLLDAGCGTGLRLAKDETALAVGVDASPEMLANCRTARVAAADVRALPFAAKEFDLIWCRLMIGHLADPQPAYFEMARVCRSGGHLFLSDFHADAVVAGHRPSFRDGSGVVHEIEHHSHDCRTHVAMAARAGFSLMAQRDGVIGQSVETFFARARRLAAYEKDNGLAVVAAFLFRRMG